MCILSSLFGVCKVWKQLKCPSADEWMKKTQYIYFKGIYSEGRRMKWCCLQRNGWNRRSSYEVKSARLTKMKITYFSLKCRNFIKKKKRDGLGSVGVGRRDMGKVRDKYDTMYHSTMVQWYTGMKKCHNEVHSVVC